MKINQLVIPIFCSILLAACGGGSSNHVENDSMIKPLAKSGIKGGYIDASEIKGPVKTISKNVLLIDGERINLKDLPEEYREHSLVDTGVFLQSVTWGRLYNKGRKELMFYQGEASKDVPNKGTVSYEGDAIQATPDDDDVAIMRSNFTVNFANKTLSGSITPYSPKLDGKKPLGKPVQLHATINGSTFSGTKNGITTKGAFYGTKAAELAGAYHDDAQKLGGVFGAKVKK